MYRIKFYRGIDSVVNIARSGGPGQLSAFTRYVLVSLSDQLNQRSGLLYLRAEAQVIETYGEQESARLVTCQGVYLGHKITGVERLIRGG
jgi:hypothetical protein